MASYAFEGAGAVQGAIESYFLEKDALIRVYYGDDLITQFMTTIDNVEVDHDIDALTDEAADALTQHDWDSRAESITIYGEVVQAIESEGGIYGTHVTFPVEDPTALVAEYEDDQLFVWAGGKWSLFLNRLREPIRHRTHELIREGHDELLRRRREGEDHGELF